MSRRPAARGWGSLTRPRVEEFEVATGDFQPVDDGGSTKWVVRPIEVVTDVNPSLFRGDLDPIFCNGKWRHN